MLDRASQAGTTDLIFSAENFAFLSDDGISKLADALPPVNLLITLNSPLRRVVSLWQELVEHGLRTSFKDSLSLLQRRQDLKADFVRRFVTGIKPNKATVILSAPEDSPGTLISSFSSAICLVAPQYNEDVRLNTRLSFIEVEMIREMNRQLFLSDTKRPINEFKRLQLALRIEMTKCSHLKGGTVCVRKFLLKYLRTWPRYSAMLLGQLLMTSKR